MTAIAEAGTRAWPATELAPYELAGQSLSRDRHAKIVELFEEYSRNLAHPVQEFYWSYSGTSFSGQSFWGNAYQVELQATFTAPRGRLLDLGCLGPELVVLREVRPDIAVDGLSIEGGIFGREESGFCSYTEPRPDRVTVRSVDAERERFPFEDASFDTVSSMQMFEHLKFGPQHVLSEAHRVLKDNGILVIATPNASSLLSVWKHCKGEHPASHHSYSRSLTYGVVHPFEYRASELRSLVTSYGFDVMAEGTFYSERYVAIGEEMAKIFDFVKSFGFPLDEAQVGDHLIIVARKSGPIHDLYPRAVFEG
jgi:SAM-dependent methyltransferase